jgi:hypothetical protein
VLVNAFDDYTFFRHAYTHHSAPSEVRYLLHQAASNDPETFITGANKAGAIAAAGSFSTLVASIAAIPPF